jgi:glycosyltransferase involved in cell wall biosynthesis
MHSTMSQFMKNESIVCFAKDWSEDPTSNNHVMKLLARDTKVLWLNSIAMRRPTFTNGHDLRKIGRKVCSFFRGAEYTVPNLWVVTPIVLPFPHSKLAAAVNRLILAVTISYYRRKIGMRNCQFWTFLPNAVAYVGKLKESLVVYYCTDAWAHFSCLDGQKTSILEQELMHRADVCFVTSRSLLEEKKRHNPRTYLALHGVDREHFARALAPSTSVPADVARLAHPIIGFIGLIDERMDFELVARIARVHPDWTIVLIGKAIVDTQAIRQFPNIYLLGRRPYADLPRYCKAFDVGMIPYAVNELTRNINPIKLREYLSAGLPVVSTALPEVEFYKDSASIVQNHAEFLSALEEELRSDSPARRNERSDTMRSETWEVRVADIGSKVGEIATNRAARMALMQ